MNVATTPAAAPAILRSVTMGLLSDGTVAVSYKGEEATPIDIRLREAGADWVLETLDGRQWLRSRFETYEAAFTDALRRAAQMLHPHRAG